MNDKARRELEREASYLRFLLRVSDWADPDSPTPLRNALARLESNLRVESSTDSSTNSSTNSGRVRKWRRLIPWARPKR
jgi:hypothetical protein